MRPELATFAITLFLFCCEQQVQSEAPAPSADLITPSGATMLADPEGISSGSVEALALPELEALNFGRFVTSAACALCHSNHFAASAMRGSEGEDLGPFNLWQGTMMANASRDPFW